MKKSCFFVGRVLLIVMGGIAALPLAAQTITLTGRVRTTDGDPLAARITILRGLPAAGIETHDTAADGTFSLKTSSAGVQVVSASADGYASREAYRSGGARFPRLHFVLAWRSRNPFKDTCGTAPAARNRA